MKLSRYFPVFLLLIAAVSLMPLTSAVKISPETATIDFVRRTDQVTIKIVLGKGVTGVSGTVTIMPLKDGQPALYDNTGTNLQSTPFAYAFAKGGTKDLSFVADKDADSVTVSVRFTESLTGSGGIVVQKQTACDGPASQSIYGQVGCNGSSGTGTSVTIVITEGQLLQLHT